MRILLLGKQETAQYHLRDHTNNLIITFTILAHSVAKNHCQERRHACISPVSYPESRKAQYMLLYFNNISSKQLIALLIRG